MPDTFTFEEALEPASFTFEEASEPVAAPAPQEPGRITQQPQGIRGWGQFLLGGMLHPIRQAETAIEQTAIGLGLADPGSRLLPGLSLSRALETPIIKIPQIPQQEGTAAQLGAGAVNAVTDFVNFFGTPEGIATVGLGMIPATLRKAVLTGFATSMATEAPGQLQEAVKLAKEGKYQEAAQQAVSGVGGVALSAAIGRGLSQPGATHPSVTLPRSFAELSKMDIEMGRGIVPFPPEAGGELQIPYRVPSTIEQRADQPAGAATFLVDPAGRAAELRGKTPQEQAEILGREFRPPEPLTPGEPFVERPPTVVGEGEVTVAPKAPRTQRDIVTGKFKRGIVLDRFEETVAAKELPNVKTLDELVERVRKETPDEPMLIAAEAVVRPERAAELLQSWERGAVREAPAGGKLPSEPPPPTPEQVAAGAPSPVAGLISGTKAEQWADQVLSEPRDSLRRMMMGVEFDPKDPQRMAALVIKGAAMIERGVRDVAQWGAEMVQRFGEQIRPHLDEIYKRSQVMSDLRTGRTTPTPQEPAPAAPPPSQPPPGTGLLNQVVEAFRPKVQENLPRTVSTAGDWLADLGDRAQNKKIANDPTGIGRIPVLNWLLDPRHRAKTEPEKSIITYYYEQGQGQAQVKALGSTFGTRFKELFPRNEQTGEFTSVGRTQDGQSLHPQDVFSSLQRNPQSYRLSPEQRQAFDELMRYERRAREMEAQYGIHENPVTGNIESGPREGGNYYTRGHIVGRPGVERGVGQATEQAAVRSGFSFPLNVDDRILVRLSRLYKAIAERRLAEDEGLGGRWGTETEPITHQEARVFNPAFRSGSEYRIYPVEVAKRIKSSLRDEETRWLKAMGNINDFLKSITLGFDWGVGQIQGLVTAFKDPKAWSNAQATSLRAFGSREAFAEYVRHNAEAVRELAQFGSGIGTTPEMITGLSEGGVVSRVPRAIGGAVERAGFPQAGRAIRSTQEAPQAFGRMFQTFLDVAKVEKWKARREITPREEWPRAIQEIEHELNLGRMETIGVSPAQALAERLLLLAPSYYRGGLGLIGDMAQKNVTGAQARRAMGHYMGGVLATYAGLAALSGMPWEEFKRRLDPSKGNFLMIPIKLGDKSIEVGFGGIFRSFVRLGGEVMETSIKHPENWKSLSSEKNPFTKWLRGHSAPVVSKVWDQFSGKDYAGEDADMFSLGRGSLPLVLQSWLTQEKGQTGEQTAADVVFSFLGLLSWPQNARNKLLVERNRQAIAQFGAPYENLKIREQAAVMRAVERNPEFAITEPPTRKQIEEGFRHQLDRQEQVQAGLDKSIRDVLTAKELRVPGFEPTVQIGPTKIYLTSAQMDRYKSIIIEEYNRTLKNRLGILNRVSPTRGQELLNDWAAQAKQRAANKMKIEFNR